MWQACLTALAGSEKESSGALKGVTILKSQWQKVCPSYIYVCAYLTSNYTVQLKWEYEIIKGLCNLLGVGWNEVMKRVKAEPSVWDAYCKVRLSCIYVGLHCSPHLPPPSESPQGESLSQEGFPLFDKIGNLVDGTRATGEFMFRAGQSPGPSYTRHSSPATPPGDDFDSRINPVLLGISNNSAATTRSLTPFHWEGDVYSENETPNILCTHLLLYHNMF